MNGADKDRRLLAAEHSGQWNASTLHDYFEMRLNMMQSALDRRFDVQAEAVALAKNEAERATDRAERIGDYNKAQQNEWRGALSDLSARMVTRQEYMGAHDSLMAAFETKHNALSESYETRHKDLQKIVNENSDRINAHVGEQKGSGQTVAWVFAAGGIAIAAITLIMNI